MAAYDAVRLQVTDLKSPLAGPFALSVAAGACAVITGASGSGKSLFLRMVADLDPNDGDVRLDGQDRAALAPSAWRLRASYVAAEAGWWMDKVSDHFAPGQRAPALAYAGQMGLESGLYDALVSRLSTGEKQRFALIRTLVLEPPLMLLDEPTGALDQASVNRVEHVIRERMKAGAAVVMVTHDDALAERIGSQHYRMSERRLSRL